MHRSSLVSLLRLTVFRSLVGTESTDNCLLGRQEMAAGFCPTISVNGSEIVACIWPAFALLRLGSLLHARLLIGMARLKRSARIFPLDVAFFMSNYLSM